MAYHSVPQVHLGVFRTALNERVPETQQWSLFPSQMEPFQTGSQKYNWASHDWWSFTKTSLFQIYFYSLFYLFILSYVKKMPMGREQGRPSGQRRMNWNIRQHCGKQMFSAQQKRVWLRCRKRLGGGPSNKSRGGRRRCTSRGGYCGLQFILSWQLCYWYKKPLIPQGDTKSSLFFPPSPFRYSWLPSYHKRLARVFKLNSLWYKTLF